MQCLRSKCLHKKKFYSTFLIEESKPSYQIWKSINILTLQKHFEKLNYPHGKDIIFPSNSNIISIHTDGSCIYRVHDTAIAGIGIAFENFTQFNRSEPVILPSFRPPTNNIAELCACIRALQLIQSQPHNVILYSDSSYVVNVMNSWLFNWKEKILTNTLDKPKLNLDLILQLAMLCQQRWQNNQSMVKFVFESGHSNLNLFNTIAHNLAFEASKQQKKV